jgi:hypothetical protein
MPGTLRSQSGDDGSTQPRARDLRLHHDRDYAVSEECLANAQEAHRQPGGKTNAAMRLYRGAVVQLSIDSLWWEPCARSPDVQVSSGLGSGQKTTQRVIAIRSANGNVNPGLSICGAQFLWLWLRSSPI